MPLSCPATEGKGTSLPVVGVMSGECPLQEGFHSLPVTPEEITKYIAPICVTEREREREREREKDGEKERERERKRERNMSRYQTSFIVIM